MPIRRKSKPRSLPAPKRLQATLRLTLTGDDAYNAWSKKMLALADDEVFGRLLQRAAVEILLAAYQERFANALPGVIQTEKVDDPDGTRRIPRQKERVKELLGASRRLANAQVDGNRREIDAARLQLRDARKAMSGALEKKDRKGERLGPGNVFRPAVFKLMHVLTGVGYMRINKGGVGIGPRKKIMEMETPSATRHLTQKDTLSEFTSLFRQIEFGTGTHGMDPVGNPGGGLSALSGGAWYYGKSENQGVNIRGAKPAHVLWSEAGAPYSEDYDRLKKYIYATLASHIK